MELPTTEPLTVSSNNGYKTVGDTHVCHLWLKNQGRVSLARVWACEVMLACEVKSACEVMGKHMKKQGRVSLARVWACEVMLACEMKSACEVMKTHRNDRCAINRTVVTNLHPYDHRSTPRLRAHNAEWQNRYNSEHRSAPRRPQDTTETKSSQWRMSGSVELCAQINS